MAPLMSSCSVMKEDDASRSKEKEEEREEEGEEREKEDKCTQQSYILIKSHISTHSVIRLAFTTSS